MKMIWNYQQIELGFNFRMNELAALGLSQLKRLDQYVKRRHEIVAYDNALKSLLLITPGKPLVFILVITYIQFL